jgi:lysozyme
LPHQHIAPYGRRNVFVASGTILAIAASVIAILFYNGVILFNNPSLKEYPVRGVDVSSYQGEIDWDVLARQGIQFAFIKATEGSSFVDPHFADNYASARNTTLRIGAYHFFSYDSSGSTQADHFISVVPKAASMLPPIVDVEFYGDKEKNLPDKESMQRELSVLLAKLEEQYGMKPILYATEKSYALYIANAFDEYDIWIRNTVTTPTLSDGRAWTFWQYTNRETLDGYRGAQRFIDMNVFRGTQAAFDVYPTK